jgi:endonuclease I
VFIRTLPQIILCLLATALAAVGQALPPVSYYDAAIGQAGAGLKAALKNAIDGHMPLPYTAAATDTWDALKVLDEDPVNALNVLLVYSGYSVAKSEQWTGSTGIWDREHLWPQSYGLQALNADSRARRDIHNLNPCDVSVNSSRGNKYYDETTPPGTSYPDAPESSYDSDSWEPRAADKGPIARAMFYMATRYDGSDPDVPDLELSETPNSAMFRFGKLTTLLAWHRQYPVTAAEQRRNQIVFTSYQFNRNPFVDHPEWADMIFAGTTPLEAWRRVYFTAAELGNPALSGPNADLDGDGAATLLEYVFRTDPGEADAVPLTAYSAVIGPTRYVVLIFPRNRFATDMTISYEACADLAATWLPVVPTASEVLVTDFETERVTVYFPAPEGRYFVRARVTAL